MGDLLWTFETARFRVTCEAVPDDEPDLSWRDEEQVEYDETHGVCYYGMIVRVYCNSREIGNDSLWGCGYSDPREFVTAHRDPDPLNRNSTARPDYPAVRVGHYFPDMVAEAIRRARETLANPPRLRAA